MKYNAEDDAGREYVELKCPPRDLSPETIKFLNSLSKKGAINEQRSENNG